MSLMNKGAFGQLPAPLQYIYNIVLMLSQVLSTLLLGDPDESFSSRTGKAVESGAWIPKYLISPLLDLMFFEKDHALKSIERDEGIKEIWSWRKKD